MPGSGSKGVQWRVDFTESWRFFPWKILFSYDGIVFQKYENDFRITEIGFPQGAIIFYVGEWFCSLMLLPLGCGRERCRLRRSILLSPLRFKFTAAWL